MGKGTGCNCEVGTVFLLSLIGGTDFSHLAVKAEGPSNQLATSLNNLEPRRELGVISSRPASHDAVSLQHLLEVVTPLVAFNVGKLNSSKNSPL